MDLQNVAVENHGSHFGSEHNGLLSWEYKGFRYHIWPKDTTVLYKRPVERKPGNRVGKIDATAKANARMVAEARSIAEREGLYAKAAEEMRLKDEIDKAANVTMTITRRTQ